MTQFIAVMSALIVSGLGASLYLFRKGGPYNPKMPDFTDLPYLPESQSTPVLPVIQPVATSSAPIAPKNRLGAFCDAIEAMEGANPANNNPGNCRCSPVGYLPMYGKVTCNPHGFAVFPTKALGRTYLENMVHFKAHNHPTWTIYDFFASYAPSTDGNNPKHYAEFVAGRLGVVPTIQLQTLFA